VSDPASRLRLWQAGTLRSLRHRNFRLFFTGQLVSLSGTWMQQVAQSWLVYSLTHSPLLLGLAAFATRGPILVFGLLGGVAADRLPRRRIVIITQTLAMLQAFALAALVLSGHVQVWHVFVLAAVLGVINAFDMPARQAFLFELVGPEDVPNAIALNSSAVNAARIVGPSIAGILVAAWGEGACFLLNGVSFLAVLAGLLAMRGTWTAERVRARSALREVLAGFHYAWNNERVRALLILLAASSLLGMPYMTLMPIFAGEILDGGSKALGFIMGAAGAGALAAALSLAGRTGTRGLGRRVAASSAIFGAALIVFASSRTFWLSVPTACLLGFGMIGQMAATNTLLQTIVPDGLRGRIMALYAMSIAGLAPVGGLIMGAAADRIGAPRALATGGVIVLAVSAWFSIARRRSARAESPKS
jgi:MFS family permease